ncbi:hypothetical protein F9C07_3047 [Aspergillus flavus]|uniref:Uncharacterized protein n=1 Tax=Aspergillus flavus (strain ATCC 200026 / FGSC A1120 / IAM 13836 / NRRL 3357 / JCM 12722 / SRRC 167) TaxID=332952 RepID=A0A7U2ME27_ASPFN|nr:hypothetical protein F9C07_3047 [Aspergillus flavus]
MTGRKEIRLLDIARSVVLIFKGYSKKGRNGTTPYHVVDHGFGMLSGVSSATQAIGQ